MKNVLKVLMSRQQIQHFNERISGILNISSHSQYSEFMTCLIHICCTVFRNLLW